MWKNFIILCLSVSVFASCKQSANKENWIQLFNGKDLTGWTVKIKGYPAGENFGNTFSVENGVIKVKYDAYGNDFQDRFGHLFTNETYSHYKLRVEYRFTGEQVNGGPGWAYRNSGAMLHSQNPNTMAIDQDFPVSVEAQMLGGNGTDNRTTGNVCTPGTEIYIDGKPYKDHCYSAKSKTYHGDQWVTLEVVVLGDKTAYHIMDGDTILTYTNMTVGGGGVNPKPDIPDGPLTEGRIALQSESHPIEFRKVEFLDLTPKK